MVDVLPVPFVQVSGSWDKPVIRGFFYEADDNVNVHAGFAQWV